ncbi:MAG TPA: 3-oxoacyl-ACP reductase FabG [Burkholderiales bacterium]|nr:3-oxoacyl-ACP reductase FabG [Burkholderiales bacterium]
MKRALVTGGSGALGAAIARALAADGLHVVVHANTRRAEAERVATGIAAAGGSAEAVAFDATDAEGTRAAVERLLDAGAIQVLVNNAGIHRDGIMAGMRGEAWREVVAVSLDGFFNVTKPLLLPMLRTRWGRIVNVSSVSAIMGNRGQTNYAAAKAGLIGATRALALECASRGVTVNAIAPGIIESEATAKAFSAERVKALVPMQRAGTPEEVASLVAFLACDRAGYISGQVIAVDGALS